MHLLTIESAGEEGWGEDPQSIEIVQYLLSRHAEISVRSNSNSTPLDFAFYMQASSVRDILLAAYRDRLVAQYGTLAYHTILREAVCEDFTQDREFHTPLHPLRIRLAVSTLSMGWFDTLLRSFDANELIRSCDTANNGALPIHLACSLGPFEPEILGVLVDLDPTTLHISDNTGMLPVHCLCNSGHVNLEALRFLVDRGGVGTLSARDRDGALPLHSLLGAPESHSKLECVELLLILFPGSASMKMQNGDLPIMVATKSGFSSDVLLLLLKAYPQAVAYMKEFYNS